MGREFGPGRDAFRQAVECAIKGEAAVYDRLVLLIWTVRAGQDEETITLNCNQNLGRRMCALGFEPLFS